MTAKHRKVEWLDYPESHDFEAARKYLTLILPPEGVRVVLEQLAQAGITHRPAKDLLRAGDLEPLPADNEHVARDLEKVHKGVKLSPVLGLSGAGERPFAILDGYHRVSTAYHVDENTSVPLLLA